MILQFIVLIGIAICGLLSPVCAQGAAPSLVKTHTHPHSPADAHDHGDQNVLSPTAMSSTGWGLIAGYGIAIIAASLLGGAIPGRVAIGHASMQHLISVISGLMLGIAIFHLLPHALQHLGAGKVDLLMLAVMAGIVTMFFLLRAFHFHQHDIAPMDRSAEPPAEVDFLHGALASPETPPSSETVHGNSCNHGHHHHTHQTHELSWVGLFIGLGIHTVIDGLALGASVQAELSHLTGFGLAGLGTFLAIVLHQPLDSMSFTSLMITGGWSRWTIRAANLVFALLCPLGAAMFVGGIGLVGGGHDQLVALALGFSAGVFLCIALSDLLPEMEFHSHNRFSLSACLMLGIILAWGIGFLEPDHVHQ